MKKLFFLFTFYLLAVLSANASTADSLRTETKEGATFVVHKVEAGQTLYAVMRKYKTTIQALKDANPGMKDNLVTGQIVRIPRMSVGKKTEKPIAETKLPEKSKTTKKTIEEEKIVIGPQKSVEDKPKEIEKPVVVQKLSEAKSEKEAKPDLTKPDLTKPDLTKPDFVMSKTGVHKVEGKQSLYGIAVKYGILMADVRRWNNLSSDQLFVGQEIIVTENAYREHLKKSKIDSAKLAETRPNDKVVVIPSPIPVASENADMPEPKIVNSGKRVIESGMAEVIDAMDNSNKYLALHRTAAVGSLVQVKNLSNSQTVWVKVVGKLPSISVNDRIIIKLSARAQEKLSPNGKRFLSEISYLSE